MLEERTSWVVVGRTWVVAGHRVEADRRVEAAGHRVVVVDRMVVADRKVVAAAWVVHQLVVHPSVRVAATYHLGQWVVQIMGLLPS